MAAVISNFCIHDCILFIIIIIIIIIIMFSI
jgi:hypothetical protein